MALDEPKHPGWKELTDKEEAFCQQYLVDFNGARAARAAGYSEDSAKEIASQNLTKPHIQARIGELRQDTGKMFNITRERIAQELALIAFGDTKHLFGEDGKLLPPNEWGDQGRIVSGYEESETVFGDEDNGGVKKSKKVRQWEKTKALEQLTRLMGFNAPEKAPVDGDGKTVRNDVHIKIIRDTASSIAPGEFTPQPATGTESKETL